MKKYLIILSSLLLGLAMTSCSSDNDDSQEMGESSRNYVNVQNATYTEGTMPSATSQARLQASISTSTLSSSQTAIIRVAKDRIYKRFFIGVKGKSGYWTYTPSSTRAADDSEEWYVIPIGGSGENSGGCTLQVSGEEENGSVTQPFETDVISRTDGSMGAFVTSISGGTSMYSYSMEYDNLSRLTRFASSRRNSESISVTISYEPMLTITYHEYSSHEDEDVDVIRLTAELNAKGFISAMSGGDSELTESASFSYDEEGHLTSLVIRGNDYGELFTTTITQTWTDGNLTSFTTKSTDEDPYSVTMTYGEYVNQQHQFYYGQTLASDVLDALYAAGLLGVVSEKLPIEIHEMRHGRLYTSKSTYTFNDNGTINTQTITQNGVSVELKYAY